MGREDNSEAGVCTHLFLSLNISTYANASITSCLPSAEISNEGFQVVTWRGAQWALFVRRCRGSPAIDVYLKIENPDDLSADWSCPVYFTFTIITPSGQRSKYARGE
jgi:hypothetical protein